MVPNQVMPMSILLRWRIVAGFCALLLILGLYGCGGCPDGTRRVTCIDPRTVGYLDTFDKCCKPEISAYDCCFPFAAANAFQLSIPDLSYTNLDGLVNFGKTTLKVEIPADGDSLETKLKGRVAIAGGVCDNPPCPLTLLLVELRSVQDSLTTANGRVVSGLFARNANTWTGTREADGTITMDANNKLLLQATIDGQKQTVILNANDYFTGMISYNKTRLTDTGNVKSNLITITGNFADENAKATLHIEIWATNCKPAIHPSVTCRHSVDPGPPGTVHFDSKAELLENLYWNSHDLCDALMDPDYAKVCTAGGDVEFPSFGCQRKKLPLPDDIVEIDKLLKFSWQDANGNVFSNQRWVDLNYLPLFPVKLTVENKWGRKVSGEIAEVPQDLMNCNCAKPCPLAFGVVSGAGIKQSGTPNWSSSYNSADKCYEITISGEDPGYTTVVTPSFGTGSSGFCRSGSINGKLVVGCYDHNGNPVTPASFAFVSFKKPAWPPDKGPLAFGVVSAAGFKLSGTPNWSSSSSGTLDYEIAVDGENYQGSDYISVVTPIDTNCFCTTGSVNGKLLVNCWGHSSNLVPGRFAFVSFKKPAGPADEGPLAFGVVSGDGSKRWGGTLNWNSIYDSAKKRYEITIPGENYYYGSYTTVVTSMGATAGPWYRYFFCTTSSVNGKLLVSCWDDGGNAVAGPFAFAVYRNWNP